MRNYKHILETSTQSPLERWRFWTEVINPHSPGKTGSVRVLPELRVMQKSTLESSQHAVSVQGSHGCSEALARICTVLTGSKRKIWVWMMFLHEQLQ